MTLAPRYVGGAIFSGLGLYLIGPSPWFGGALPQTQIVVLLGYMLSNAGVAVFVPCMTPLALEVFDRAGYTQKQVKGRRASRRRLPRQRPPLPACCRCVAAPTPAPCRHADMPTCRHAAAVLPRP
jgi:hypothetical protein